MDDYKIRAELMLAGNPRLWVLTPEGIVERDKLAAALRARDARQEVAEQPARQERRQPHAYA